MDPAEAIAWVKANPAYAVTGLWAINFLLSATGLLTFGGQRWLSLILAISAVVLLVKKNRAITR